MTTLAKETTEAKPKNTGIVPNIISGLATGLFSIPEGMAYAQLAGVNPVYGMYSGIVATIVASLSTGTVLMISTLTSAIALTTASVLTKANIQDSQMPQALFTVTFLTGAIMFLLGIARLGSIVNFVSNAVMTGFVAGASLLIILGQEHHLTGYKGVGANEWQQTMNWLQNISLWDWTTVMVSIGVIFMMVIFKRIRPLERYAAIIVLALGTIIVNALGIQTPLVASIATIPNGLPQFMLPNFSLVPQLLLGSISVAIVALAQGAGISTAVPNPDGSKASQSRDFIGEGLGNLAGSFFQSMGTGGSLSRTGVSVGAGLKRGSPALQPESARQIARPQRRRLQTAEPARQHGEQRRGDQRGPEPRTLRLLQRQPAQAQAGDRQASEGDRPAARPAQRSDQRGRQGERGHGQQQPRQLSPLHGSLPHACSDSWSQGTSAP